MSWKQYQFYTEYIVKLYDFGWKFKYKINQNWCKLFSLKLDLLACQIISLWWLNTTYDHHIFELAYFYIVKFQFYKIVCLFKIYIFLVCEFFEIVFFVERIRLYKFFFSITLHCDYKVKLYKTFSWIIFSNTILLFF